MPDMVKSVLLSAHNDELMIVKAMLCNELVVSSISIIIFSFSHNAFFKPSGVAIKFNIFAIIGLWLKMLDFIVVSLYAYYIDNN